MVDASNLSTGSDTVEYPPDETQTDDEAIIAYWRKQEGIADREERDFKKRGRKIIRRYRDERTSGSENTQHRFNILWSNVQTLKPLLFGRMPKADVQRRFKDEDPVGRLASEILERAIDYTIESGGLETAVRRAVDDRLLPGRGVARILYVPHFSAPQGTAPGEEAAEGGSDAFLIGSEGDEGQQEEPQAPQQAPQQVVYEECKIRAVFWEDYQEGPARSWDEVPWIRYRAYLTRDELVGRFGPEKGKRVNLDFVPKASQEQDTKDVAPDALKKAEVHEIWDKSKREVLWFAPGTPDLLLDRIDDPLGLPEFFANPDPLLATTTTEKRIPVADFLQYQDQALELDKLTARIERLTRALKVCGVYPASEKQTLQQLLDEGTENRLIPVEDWASFGEKVGPDGIILWLPIKQIAEVMLQLFEARDKAKQVLYEITGLSDILRAASNPIETATAQQLKSQYGTIRLSESQKAVARFVRDLVRLSALVIARQFSPQTISMITGYPQVQPVPQLPPQPQPPQQAVQVLNAYGAQQQALQAQQPPVAQPGQQQPQQSPPEVQQAQQQIAQFQQQTQAWQQQAQQAQQIQAQNAQLQQQYMQAIEMLRQDAMHDFRIDIEVDSTIYADEQQEKQDRVEFLQQLMPLLNQVVPLAQGNAALSALAKEITMFAVHAFKVGRSMEETIEKAFDVIAQMPPHPTTQGKTGGNSNVDSPADLALRKHETDLRTQVAMQANAIKAQQVQGQLALGAAKAEMEAKADRDKTALDAAKAADESSFRERRAVKMDAQAAQGLT